MAKRLAVTLGAVLLVAMSAAARQVKQQRTADSSQPAKKIVTISGLVGADGKTVTTDGGKIVWAVTNPEALLDSVGEQVMIRARVDAQTHELQINTVRIDPTVGARLHDAAFRR